MSALPQFSDVDLFGNGKCVVDLDPEIANRALNLRVAQQKLNRSKISRLTQSQQASPRHGARSRLRSFCLARA
jgi:hypothetical protein